MEGREPITLKFASDIAYLMNVFLASVGNFKMHPRLEKTPWLCDVHEIKRQLSAHTHSEGTMHKSARSQAKVLPIDGTDVIEIGSLGESEPGISTVVGEPELWTPT